MLWFDNPNNMEIISNKKQALQETFQLFDVKKLGRIDATELFAVILLMSKGEYGAKLLSKTFFCFIELYSGGIYQILWKYLEWKNQITFRVMKHFSFLTPFSKDSLKFWWKRGRLSLSRQTEGYFSMNKALFLYVMIRLAYDDLKKIISSIFIKDIKFLLRDEFVE